METIKLDLIPGKKMPSLHASQYDDGREHGIDLFENGVVYKLDGTETLTINERKGDDCICSLDIENTFTGSNHIVFASTEQMCAVWGNNICELVIKRGSVTLGTLNFILEIEPCPTEGGIESESEISNLERQITGITEQVIGDDYYTADQTDEAIATATEGKADTTYVNTELAKKANTSTTYTKAQSDNKFATISTTYTKTQSDSRYPAKNDVYTKIQSDGRFALINNTYSKAQVDAKIAALPEAMVFKGTLGVNGDIQTLPTASAENEGWTFKCITAGTYSGLTLKVGDTVTCFNPPNTSVYEWDISGYGDTDTDTWRAIKVNGTEELGSGISSGSVDFVGSENIEVEFDANGNKVGVKTKNIYTKTEVDNIVSDAIYNVLPDDTASGSVANFNTSLELPIKSLEVDVNAVQESGTPTPSTPLPISGWNEIKISQAGKNLLSVNDVVFEQFEERSLQNPIPSGSYVFSGVFTSTDTDSTLCSVVFVDKDDNTIVAKSLSRNTRTSVSLDLSKDCYKIRFYASTSWPSSSGDTGSFSDLQIELDSASGYEPYNGNTEVINLGGTYYGGHFTQDKDGHRQFVVTHNYALLNDDSLWQTTTGTVTYAYNYAFTNRKLFGTSTVGVICSAYPIGSLNGCARWQSATGYYFEINDNTVTLDDIKALARNGDIAIVYEIAVPIVFDLPDGEPIITLNGTNNIHADTGDSTAVFKSSVNDYVSAHSGGNLLGMGGVYLGGAKSGGSEEETDEGEDTEKVKLDEPKEEVKTIGDTKKLGGE